MRHDQECPAHETIRQQQQQPQQQYGNLPTSRTSANSAFDQSVPMNSATSGQRSAARWGTTTASPTKSGKYCDNHGIDCCPYCGDVSKHARGVLYRPKSSRMHMLSANGAFFFDRGSVCQQRIGRQPATPLAASTVASAAGTRAAGRHDTDRMLAGAANTLAARCAPHANRSAGTFSRPCTTSRSAAIRCACCARASLLVAAGVAVIPTPESNNCTTFTWRSGSRPSR